MCSKLTLDYFIRVYGQCPQDPMLLFSMGLSYLHRSMQRQSDNRHLQIMQALTMLYRYHDLRTASGLPGHVQEAEYNLGRALHQLGLSHAALPFYERALAVKNVDSKFDLTMTIAYNLQLLYILAGDTVQARVITDRYLCI